MNINKLSKRENLRFAYRHFLGSQPFVQLSLAVFVKIVRDIGD